MSEIVEDALEYLYDNSGYIYLVLSIIVVLYGVFIQLWLIVCVSVASVVFAVITFLRQKKIIKRQDEISKKLDTYTMEQKKEIIEKALPSIIQE